MKKTRNVTKIYQIKFNERKCSGRVVSGLVPRLMDMIRLEFCAHAKLHGKFDKELKRLFKLGYDLVQKKESDDKIVCVMRKIIDFLKNKGSKDQNGEKQSGNKTSAY